MIGYCTGVGWNWEVGGRNGENLKQPNGLVDATSSNDSEKAA